MAFTLRIKPYVQIPGTIKVSLDPMNHVLDTFSKIYAVMWITGKLYHAKQPSNSQTENEEPSVKRRPVLHSWHKAYVCDRSGGKESSKASTTKNSPIPRSLQKALKNICCSAIMRVTCNKNIPGNACLTFQKQHNHEIGTKEDFCFLPVSKTTKNFIMQKLTEGYECGDVRVSIQHQLNSYIQICFMLLLK